MFSVASSFLFKNSKSRILRARQPFSRTQNFKPSPIRHLSTTKSISNNNFERFTASSELRKLKEDLSWEKICRDRINIRKYQTQEEWSASKGPIFTDSSKLTSRNSTQNPFLEILTTKPTKKFSADSVSYCQDQHDPNRFLILCEKHLWSTDYCLRGLIVHFQGKEQKPFKTNIISGKLHQYDSRDGFPRVGFYKNSILFIQSNRDNYPVMINAHKLELNEKNILNSECCDMDGLHSGKLFTQASGISTFNQEGKFMIVDRMKTLERIEGAEEIEKTVAIDVSSIEKIKSKGWNGKEQDHLEISFYAFESEKKQEFFSSFL